MHITCQRWLWVTFIALSFSTVADDVAVYELLEARAQHWAYQPLSPTTLPNVNDTAWPVTTNDQFILHALEQAGLQPSAKADKPTLIRRVTYDLIGLPPTPDEVDTFLTDTRPDAYEQLVERLLASPHYGERWARHWLDVVRYTDSFDSRASVKTDVIEIWRYRDWVVNAMNSDMPYDRFVSDQVAGDVTPLADGSFNRDGLIATGMLAIGNWPQGDADKEKMVADIVDDQVDVVMRTFLGSTMACARCHDHKFDPFSTKDYYGLAGIFYSSSILPGPGMKTEGSPILHLALASEDSLAKRTAAEERLVTLRTERDDLLKQARTTFATREMAQTDRYLMATILEDTSTPELNEDVLRNWKRVVKGEIIPALQGVSKNFQNFPGLSSRQDTDSTPSAVANTMDTEVRYSTILQPAQSLVMHPAPNEGVGIVWRAPEDAIVTVSGIVKDADANCGNGIEWTLVHRASGVEETIATGQFDNGGMSTIKVDAPLGVNRSDQVLLTVLPNNEYSCDTTQVSLEIVSGADKVWSIASDILPEFAQGNPWPDAKGNPDVWWLHRESGKPNLDPNLFSPWWTALSTESRDIQEMKEAAKAIQANIDTAFSDSTSPLHAAVQQLLVLNAPFWLKSPPMLGDSRVPAINREIKALETQLVNPIEYAIGIQEGGVPTTEYAGIQDVRVHKRGEYSNLGDLVSRQMPALISGTSQRPITQGSGRLDLANWLTEDCSDLLARVMVNRVWQHHFGAGLVRTPSDFGTQGIVPTHPELLDALATQFIESGWSLKELHRTLLNSAVYQQSSHASDEHLIADPENLLLARMNRRRLDAESLRDSLMFVTDRLDTASGGPAFIDVATPRRTLYLRTNRSKLNTFVTLFDGADPTSSIATRNESTVAPQALYLMNHPLVLTAAEALSAKVGDKPVEEMYRRLYSRYPSESELAFAESTLNKMGYPESSEALTAYAQILLCSNEFYFID